MKNRCSFKNEYDATPYAKHKIEISFDTEDPNLEEMCMRFFEFCQACSFKKKNILQTLDKLIDEERNTHV